MLAGFTCHGGLPLPGAIDTLKQEGDIVVIYIVGIHGKDGFILPPSTRGAQIAYNLSRADQTTKLSLWTHAGFTIVTSINI